MARPPWAKANLLLPFTLGDVIKVPGLFRSSSTHVWERRKGDERATERPKPENRAGELGVKDMKLGFLAVIVAFFVCAL